MGDNVNQLIFSLEKSASIAKAECEKLVNNGTWFCWLFFVLDIIVISKERIVAFLEHNEVFEETLFEELVIIVHAFEHLHALIWNHTLFLGHFLVKMNEWFRKA